MKSLVYFLSTLLVVAAQTKLPIGLELKLPKDWSFKKTDDAVLLIPPGGSREPNANELYAVTILPGARTVRDPMLKQQFESQFLPPQLRARSVGLPAPFEGATGEGLIHTWEFIEPDTGTPGRLQIFVTGLSGGGVAAVMSFGKTARVRLNDPQIMSMAMSLASVAEEGATSKPDEMSVGAEEWRIRLRGKFLTPVASATNPARLYLGRDGRFDFRGQQSSKGTWRVYTQSGRSYLELRDNAGPIDVNELKLDGDAVVLNGQRMQISEAKSDPK